LLTPLRIVLIEDNARLARSLVVGLSEDGFEVLRAENGTTGLTALLEGAPVAAVLDLGLPDLDGITVVREARRRGFVGPVLILTARDAVASRVEGLDAGADDYLVKPFAYEELLARLRALVRRASRPLQATPAFPDLALARDALHVVVSGKTVALSPREHALLELLLQQRGKVLTRGEILREVFGYQFNPGTNIVEVHIAHLRRKLGEAAALVQTVRGSGYLLAYPEAQHE
jgi:DNA-binding response OmpR family regulator